MPDDGTGIGYIDRATLRRLKKGFRSRGAGATKNTNKPKKAHGRRKGGGKRR